jgi:hypothetical protein
MSDEKKYYTVDDFLKAKGATREVKKTYAAIINQDGFRVWHLCDENGVPTCCYSADRAYRAGHVAEVKEFTTTPDKGVFCGRRNMYSRFHKSKSHQG